MSKCTPWHSQFFNAHLEVWQRKDCLSRECVIIYLLGNWTLEFCLFYRPTKKGLHTLGVCNVSFQFIYPLDFCLVYRPSKKRLHLLWVCDVLFVSRIFLAENTLQTMLFKFHLQFQIFFQLPLIIFQSSKNTFALPFSTV